MSSAQWQQQQQELAMQQHQEEQQRKQQEGQRREQQAKLEEEQARQRVWQRTQHLVSVPQQRGLDARGLDALAVHLSRVLRLPQQPSQRQLRPSLALGKAPQEPQQRCLRGCRRAPKLRLQQQQQPAAAALHCQI
jgi:hypothetical protein